MTWALAAEQVDTSAVLLRLSAVVEHTRTGDHRAALRPAEAGPAFWDGSEPDVEGTDPLSRLRVAR